MINEKFKAAIFGTQNIDTEGDGAKTGNITLKQLRDVGARFTILGHSERRAMGETNEYVSERVRDAISSNFMTIVCVGEMDRKNGEEYLDFIKSQLQNSLSGMDRRGADNLIVAYEPIWAVGAPRPAASDETLEVVIHIRRTLVEMFGLENAKKIKVIYGGSITSDGVAEFVREAGVDGVLVGRASTRGKEFANIVNELNR